MEHQQTHRSHRHHRRNRLPIRGMERLLNSRLFIALGAIFLMVGVYFSLSSSDGSGGLYAMIMSLFAPAPDVPFVEVAGSGMTDLFLYFIPAILILIGALIFALKYSYLTYPASLLTAIYLVVVQIKISLFNINFGGCFYPGFYMAILFLWIPILLMLAVALQHRKPLLPLLIGVYFYVSVLLIGLDFDRMGYMFIFILIFSLLIFWLDRKIKMPVVPLINIVFAWGFLGLLWLRKIVVNSRIEFIPTFLVVGIIFFLLFYAVGLVMSAKKENHPPRWMQLMITGLNLAVYLGTTAYVIIHYYTIGYLAILVIALLLLHVLGIYILKRLKRRVWRLPHYYAIMILAGLVLPILVGQGRLILFTAVLSALMVGFAAKYKDRTSFWISVFALVVMVVYYLFNWISYCLPPMVVGLELPESSFMGYALLTGIAVIAALGFTTWKLQTAKLQLPKKWFSKQRYDRLVRVGLFLSIFLTLGWFMFVITCRFTGSLSHTPVAWFIAGAIFFIGVILYFKGHQSSFKMPFLYMSLGFALLYPLMVHWNMILYRTSMVLTHNVSGFILLLHYLALALVLVLGRLVVLRIYRLKHKNSDIRKGVELLTIGFLLFLAFTEYDNLSVILNSIQNGSPASGDSDPLVLSKYLPYSILMGITAVVVFIRSVIRQNRFIRNFAIALYCVMVVKLFVFDFDSMSPGTRSAVFLILGLLLIGFAFIYPKLLKGEPILQSFKRPSVETKEVKDTDLNHESL